MYSEACQFSFQIGILLKNRNSKLFLYRSDGVQVNSDSDLQALTTQTVYATSEVHGVWCVGVWG